MALAISEKKELSSYCSICGKFEIDTKDIGHQHDPKDVLCTGCTYLAKCPTCDNIVNVRGQLAYIHLSELFYKRSIPIEGSIVSCMLKLGEE